MEIVALGEPTFTLRISTRRAAVYVRISQDRTEQALGVARQERDCRALADRKGWTVAEVFIDNDVSATSTKPRPEYGRLLAAVQAGDVSAVVVWDVDRLTRRPRELEDFIDLADRCGLELASVGGEIDLATPQGRLMARIKGSVARHEAEQLSRRVKAKAAETAAAGRANGGGSRPYGFEDDRVTHRPEEVAVLRDAASRILNGASVRSVCQDLTRRGVLTSTGRPWSSSSLVGALTGARAAGLRAHHGAHYPASWAPVLDMETWEALRASLSARTPGGGLAARRHVWTGILRCGVCDCLLSVSVVAGKPRYVCKPAAGRGCGRLVVTQAPVDDLLTEALLRHVETADLGDADEDDDDGADLEAECARLEGRLDALAEAFADDMDPGSTGWPRAR